MSYESFPKGVYLTGHSVDTSKLGGDFVVSWMATGDKKNPLFHSHVQAAADAKKPLLALFNNDPGAFVQQYQTLNLAKWLENPRDNWLIKEVILPQIFSGGVKRRIHGVIIGMNDLWETAEKTFPDDWVISTAIFLGIAIWQLCELPVYLYMDTETAEKLPHGEKDKLTTFLASLVRYNEENQTGRPGIMEGIGTFYDALTGPILVDWSNLPYPSDAAIEKLSEKKRKSGLGNAPRTNFLCYSAGDVTLPGISGIVPLFTYVGSKSRLYEELGYTDEGSGPVLPPSGGEELPTTGDLSEVLARLKQIQDNQAVILQNQAEMTADLEAVKGVFRF